MTEKVVALLRTLDPAVASSLLTTFADAVRTDPSLLPDLATAIESGNYGALAKGHLHTTISLLAPLAAQPAFLVHLAGLL